MTKEIGSRREPQLDSCWATVPTNVHDTAKDAKCKVLILPRASLFIALPLGCGAGVGSSPKGSGSVLLGLCLPTLFPSITSILFTRLALLVGGSDSSARPGASTSGLHRFFPLPAEIFLLLARGASTPALPMVPFLPCSSARVCCSLSSNEDTFFFNSLPSLLLFFESSAHSLRVYRYSS